MKKVRTFKSKLIMFMLAIVFPLSATGAVLSLTDGLSAKATDSASTKYSSGTIQSMTLTNGNFSSSSSTGLISSPSGWSAQQNSSKATAGVINVGNSFQSNMDTYRLANNPGKKGSDKHILMINSKTATSSNNYSASQDYKSNSVTLDANSYYSFQVSFKNDTNYNSYTAYDVEKGSIQEASGYEIDASTFTVEGKDFDSHIAFTYYSSSTTYKNVYLKKSLTESGKISTIIENVEKFYEDGTYFGFMHEGTPIYVSKQYAKEYGSGNEKTYNIEPEGEITTYTCDITYNPTTKKYTVPQGTKFYGSRTAYTSLNDHTFGSIYLDGLTDENGKTIGFTEVSSKEWQTFYFFVATGDESKSVSFDLFLGSQDRGSSGVVFFDDARINKYSENEFWKTYQNYYGKSYTQETVSGEDVKTYDCTKFVNLKKSSSAIEEFGFEVGDGSESLENWEVTGTGHAQVFDTKAAQYFKSVTTYDYVGSDLSCKVTLDGEEIDLLEENKNVLALWAKDGNVQVKSKNIDVLANEIYKITAKYKVSNIESGSAYLLVSENGSLVNGERYNLSSYTLASETASSAISSNADNNFINDYGTVEFFVKGGAHYDSSINFSLALGKNGETATGCVLFDNITIEKATTDEYTNATNKLALDEKTGTQNITNGNFRSTTITEDNTYPYAPEGWTVSGAASNVWAYAGVINTETTQYNRFASLYNEMAESGIADRENPYFWAVYANPTASNGTAEAQNI
ncbi:MAG: hypothetical protein J6K39_00460, partial [Clostridia bacterium]|nr:hypothetical protein [Clostridia bacterium]